MIHSIMSFSLEIIQEMYQIQFKYLTMGQSRSRCWKPDFNVPSETKMDEQVADCEQGLREREGDVGEKEVDPGEGTVRHVRKGGHYC